MSHIDTIDHAHIGWFSGIAVYHPLQEDPFYGFDEKSIIIGGGSGEHEIFVIHDMNECLKRYVYIMTSDFDYYRDFGYQSFWNIENSYNFYKSVRKELKRLDMYPEKYIAASIGEFLAKHGLTYVKKGYIEESIFNKAHEIEKEFSGKINGLKLADKDKWGKIIKNNEVVWGYSYLDEFNDFNEA